MTTATLPQPRRVTGATLPRTGRCALDLYAYERWFANVLLGPIEARRLVPPPFLDPRPTPEGHLVMSLCCIFLDHAVPRGLPRWLGPASHNCALRIACTDVRDGSPAVWVAQRHTDSPLAWALDLAGFPATGRRLRVGRDRPPGSGLPVHLSLRTADGGIDLDLRAAGATPRPLALRDAATMDDYVGVGTRGYGPAPERDRFSLVQLEKLSANRFARVDTLGGRLTVDGVARGIDGVYLTRDGRYRWSHLGWCDRDGRRVGPTTAA